MIDKPAQESQEAPLIQSLWMAMAPVTGREGGAPGRAGKER